MELPPLRKATVTGVFSVLFVIIMWAAAWAQPNSKNHIVGDLEKVKVAGPQGAVELIAKIDTGADLSSIDAEVAKSIGLEPIFGDRKRILSTRGFEIRDTVRVTFVLGHRTISTLATIADRSRLSTKILIGRRDLGGFVVDPFSSFLTEPGEVKPPSFSSIVLKNFLYRPEGRLIILFPIMGTIMVFLRLIIGIRTFGIFAPIVITFSLLEIPLFDGLLLYLFFIAAGMGIKFLILDHIQMPHIVELSLIMFVLVILFMGASSLTDNVPISVVEIFFPLIITSHLIEQATKTVEEHRMQDAVFLLFATLAVALVLSVLGKYLLTQKITTLWIIFALSFFVTAAIGRYTGLRVSEYFRFWALRRERGGKNEP